jgi:FkbM family methyltransferase
MALRVRTWKRRTAEKLSVLLDRVEQLAGRRFYELHLEAAALRHRQGSNVVELRAGNHLIKFRTPSAKALWRAKTLLDKEPATIRWIDTFAPGEVLWDIGANIGIYTLYAGVVKGIEVLAFEPAAFNHALLCDNIRLNGLEDRVAAYGLAFADRSGVGTLTVADDEPGAAVASVGTAPVGRLKQAALFSRSTISSRASHLAFRRILRSMLTGSRPKSSKGPAIRSPPRASNRFSSRSMSATARGLSGSMPSSPSSASA